jgi:hypothetical protein
LRSKRKARESGRFAEEEVDLVAKSIELAWSSKRDRDRLIHMLEAVVYAIEGIRKVLASYD